jgi:hypothetical protein
MPTRTALIFGILRSNDKRAGNFRKSLTQIGALVAVHLFIVSAAVAEPVCAVAMTPAQCVEAQLKATSEILGSYKMEVARLEAQISGLKDEIKSVRDMLGPQVGFMPCYKKFQTTNEPPLIEFQPADCQNVQPKKDWTYTAILFGTTLCGGIGNYEISPDPFKPNIRFFGKPCAAKDSEVWVHYVGFNPRAF